MNSNPYGRGLQNSSPQKERKMKRIEEIIEDKMNEIQEKINKLYHMPKTEKNLDRLVYLWEEYEKLERALLQIY
jgi:hypothetical protein